MLPHAAIVFHYLGSPQKISHTLTWTLVEDIALPYLDSPQQSHHAPAALWEVIAPITWVVLGNIVAPRYLDSPRQSRHAPTCRPPGNQCVLSPHRPGRRTGSQGSTQSNTNQDLYCNHQPHIFLKQTTFFWRKLNKVLLRKNCISWKRTMQL